MSNLRRHCRVRHNITDGFNFTEEGASSHDGNAASFQSTGSGSDSRQATYLLDRPIEARNASTHLREADKVPMDVPIG